MLAFDTQSKSIFCKKCFVTRVAKETYLCYVWFHFACGEDVCLSRLCLNLVVYEQTSQLKVLHGLTSTSTKDLSKTSSSNDVSKSILKESL